jgi:hypothetical protein
MKLEILYLNRIPKSKLKCKSRRSKTYGVEHCTVLIDAQLLLL